jgi:outer membrane protein assembly factor BamB
MPRFRSAASVLCLCMAGISPALLFGSDWPRWRGPDDTGSTSQGDYPETLNEESMLWKAPLPGKGCSTPIVVNQTIYVTAPVQGRDALLAIDWSGKQLWQAVFDTESAGKHRNGSGCNASAVSDGRGVFVYFKSGTLASVNPDGSIRWKTNIVERFGSDTLYWDHGTSPVLTASHVILARMHNGESWVAAFDKQSGEMAWKTARNYQTPQEGDHGYATPLIINHGGRETILTWGAEHLTMHDAETGKLVWSCGNFNPAAEKLWPSISTPVIVGDTAVIAFGRNDRGKPRLHGVRLVGTGDVTASGHAWLRDDVGTFVPSPVAHGGKIYIVRDGGEVECLDPATGRSFWQNSFPKHRTNYYASPVIAAGKIYAPREDGVVFVASLSDNGMKVLSENNMQEPIIGSPVPVNGRLLLRGEKHLFCLSSDKR